MKGQAVAVLTVFLICVIVGVSIFRTPSSTAAVAGVAPQLQSAPASPPPSLFLQPVPQVQMLTMLGTGPAAGAQMPQHIPGLPAAAIVLQAIPLAPFSAQQVTGLQAAPQQALSGAVPDITVGQEARMIIESSQSGGFVTPPRKMASVNLALMALRVPGDFVETGVYNGGTAVLLAKVLQTKDKSRSLWAADSFAGLPAESESETARQINEQKESGYNTNGQRETDLAESDIEGHNIIAKKIGNAGEYSVPRLAFESNLEAHGLGNSTTNPQIKVLAGFFNETLRSAPIQQIAFLRLDGDIYVSTMDALTSLYYKVVPGGYIYVDDYGSYIGCANAVNDFRKHHGITEPMHPINEGGKAFEALWWQKSLGG